MLDSLGRQAQSSLALDEAREGYDFEADWREWLGVLFHNLFSKDFAPQHEEFWEWVWSIQPKARPSPLVAVWARGCGKSTNAEASVISVAALRKRKYGLYLSGTQEQADDHVQTVAAMLESPAIEFYYPELADRAVGKYGSPKGWRRDRLRTASGFTLDAVGLQTGLRGAKLDGDRPDFIIIDDIDGKHDSAETVEKKIGTLTHDIIPAGSSDVAILAVQNLIHEDSIFSRLAGRSTKEADFLQERVVSGPHPAIENLAVEQRGRKYYIIGGTPTWPGGQDLEVCQQMLGDMGYKAFKRECQHEVQEDEGGLFSDLNFEQMHVLPEDVPELERVVVWCDPAVSNTPDSDCNGIQVDGRAGSTIYRLWSWEQQSSPEETLQTAIWQALHWGADVVGVETDQGGDVWRSAYREAIREVKEQHREGYEDVLYQQYLELGGNPETWTYDEKRDYVEPPWPTFQSAKAGSGAGPKVHRWSLMLQAYERGNMLHVCNSEGTHNALERALKRVPKAKPYDLVDAAFWAWRDISRPVKRLRAY